MNKKASRKAGHNPSTQKKPGKVPAWQVVHPRAAGIDVGATEHYVAVPPDSVAGSNPVVRRFGGFTQDLEELVEWLKACQVDTVVMESTGVYWVALFQKIEAAGMEALLVDARAVKQVPGRKTDVKDCQWLQQLHSYGLLRAAFRPDDPICRLRALVRHRGVLVGAAAEHIQHMQKALTQMNIHLHHVVSHLTGETGLRILRAIVAGERDPEQLIKLRDPQITRSTPEEMKKALTGDWREECLFVLGQCLGLWDFYHRKMDECDQAIEEQLKRIPSAQPPPPPDKPKEDKLASQNPRPKAPQSRKRNDPERDLRPELTRICGLDLTSAHGLRVLTVLTLVSEIGLDMSVWRNEKAFTSWLGLCPNNKISGGKILSSRTRKVANRASTALRMAALGVAETQTWLGSFYRRMKGRLGPAGAITATARKIAVVIYHLLKHKEAYVERDLAKYEERIYKHQMAFLKRKAKALGMKLIPVNEEQTVAE
jgi:transposase